MEVTAASQTPAHLSPRAVAVRSADLRRPAEQTTSMLDTPRRAASSLTLPILPAPNTTRAGLGFKGKGRLDVDISEFHVEAFS